MYNSSISGVKGATGAIGATGPVGAVGFSNIDNVTSNNLSFVGYGGNIVGGNSNVAIGGYANVAIGGYSLGSYTNLYQVPEYDYTMGYDDSKSFIKLSQTKIKIKTLKDSDDNVEEIDIDISGKKIKLFETLERIDKLEKRIEELESIVDSRKETVFKVVI